MKLAIIKDLGLNLPPGKTVMDFGCGSGTTVVDLRELGYEAFGCDIDIRSNNEQSVQLQQKNIIRQIDLDDYVIPFPDNFFDAILSDQVFEHVQNYSEAIAELARVLKPDGFCLHIFPSRYIPIEPHLFVPFGSVLKNWPWLYLWASLGVHNKHQGTKSSKDGTTAKEIADFNYQYLRTGVNYLPKSSLVSEFNASFDEVKFCEREFLKNSRSGKYVYSASRLLPFLPALCSSFYSRTIVTTGPKKDHESSHRLRIR